MKYVDFEMVSIKKYNEKAFMRRSFQCKKGFTFYRYSAFVFYSFDLM